MIERPYNKRRCTETSGFDYHVLHAETAKTSLTRTCLSHGRYPKDLLYSELGAGSRKAGRPALRFGDVVKQDLKDINVKAWETIAQDRARWRRTVKKHLLIAKS